MQLLFRYDYTIYGEDLSEFFIGFMDELDGEESFVHQAIMTVVFQDYSTMFRDYSISPFTSDPTLELEQRIRCDLEDQLTPDGTACVTVAVWGQ